MVLQNKALKKLHIDHDWSYNLSDTAILAWVIRHGHTLQELSIYERDTEDPLSDEGSSRLIHISKHAEALVSLVLEGEGILLRSPRSMYRMHHLERLELKDVSFETSTSSPISQIIAACQGLRHLALESIQSSSATPLVIESCPLLETLSFECLTGCSEITVKSSV